MTELYSFVLWFQVKGFMITITGADWCFSLSDAEWGSLSVFVIETKRLLAHSMRSLVYCSLYTASLYVVLVLLVFPLVTLILVLVLLSRVLVLTSILVLVLTLVPPRTRHLSCLPRLSPVLSTSQAFCKTSPSPLPLASVYIMNASWETFVSLRFSAFIILPPLQCRLIIYVLVFFRLSSVFLGWLRVPNFYRSWGI